jgi:hypothetical protein
VSLPSKKLIFLSGIKRNGVETSGIKRKFLRDDGGKFVDKTQRRRGALCSEGAPEIGETRSVWSREMTVFVPRRLDDELVVSSNPEGCKKLAGG